MMFWNLPGRSLAFPVLCRVGVACLSIVLLWGLVGCQYESIRRAQLAHRDAAPEIAREELVGLLPPEAGFVGPHAVLGWLELGSADHAVGRYDASSRALLRAEAGFDSHDARAQTSVSEEAFSAITSPLSVAYRGSPTDRVMAPTLRAVNAMLAGDEAGARSALNEAAIRQQLAIEQRRSAIDAARAETRSASSDRVDVSRSVAGAMADPAFAEAFRSLDQYEPYRGFVNPFSEMLHAAFRLAVPVDGADRDRATALLRSVAGTVENRFVREALLEVDGGESAPSVHVFFATGFCPIRDEFRLDLPLFFFNDTVDYVGIAFPRLAFDDDAVGYLDLESPDALVRTEMLADMDRLMAIEFREELPTLMRRAIIATVAKTAAAYGINEATRDDETANALARIAAGLYLYSQNRADTRAWATLPKSYQYARLAAPSDGRVLVSTPDGQSVFVDVAPDSDTIVFVRSLRPGVGLRVRSVRFGSGAGGANVEEGPEKSAATLYESPTNGGVN